MSAPVVTVEIGFEATPTLGTNFILDAGPVTTGKGALDNSTNTLAGTVYIDVTQWCSGQIVTNRGRSRETDQYTAGTMSFVLRNEDRRFDPANTASPYYPGIVPRARVNAYLDGVQIFAGYVDDYDINYEKPNICTVAVTCVDGFTLLANTQLNSYSPASMTSGARITDAIGQSSVAFPATVSIAAGQSTLQVATTAVNNTATLDYCQTCARSENGYFFVARDGVLTFFDRYKVGNETNQVTFTDVPAALNDATFALWDDPSDTWDNVADAWDSDSGPYLGYQGIGQKSQALLLYNGANGTRTAGTIQMASDAASITKYGPRTLPLGTLENQSDSEVLNLCQYLVGRYSTAEVWFDSLSLELNGRDLATRQQLAALDLVQLATVTRTPPGTGTPSTISKLQIVDGIAFVFDVSASTYRMNLRFGSVDTRNFFKLDDAVFGVLDTSKLNY